MHGFHPRKVILVMTAQAEFGRLQYKELRQFGAVHLMAGAAHAARYRRMGRGIFEGCLVMAGIAEAGHVCVQELFTVRAVRIVTTGAHPALNRCMDILVFHNGCLIMAIETEPGHVRDKQLRRICGMRVMAARAAHGQGCMYVLLRKHALVMASVAEVRLGSGQALRHLAGHLVGYLSNIQTRMASGAAHAYRRMDGLFLCKVSVAHAAVNVLRVCPGDAQSEKRDECYQT